MKPELTPELKARFFALYFDLPVKTTEMSDGQMFNVGPKVTARFGSYLLLRPISAITDEEAIEVAKLANGKNLWGEQTPFIGRQLLGDYMDSHHCSVSGNQWLTVHDYLRSIGAALPYMGYTVEELVEAGWVKLVEP